MTGIASAAKFVPQRGENRLGRAVSDHASVSERDLGRGDRSMLGAVQTQGAAAEEPGDDQGSRSDARGELEPRRQRDERERQHERTEEDEPLSPSRDTSTARERRHRRGQLEQAADERDARCGSRAGPASRPRTARRSASRMPSGARSRSRRRSAAPCLRAGAARLRGRRARGRRRHLHLHPPTQRRKKTAARRVPDGLSPLAVRPI